MNTLYILYDPTCPHSLRHREWLAGQEPLVPLRLLSHRAEEVPCRFPGIEAHLTPRELTVISDEGQLWTGSAAAVMCLYALVDYREFAQRLALPALFPLARTALELFSREEHLLTQTRLLMRSSDVELENILRKNTEAVPPPRRMPPLPVLPTTRA